jgi:hypothetical protein
MLRSLAAFTVLAGLAACALAQTNYPETEPNETRATANGPFTLNPGDTLSGESHGTGSFFGIVANGSFDYYNLKPVATPAGIYRNTLTVTAPSVCAVVTAGFSQIDGVYNYNGTQLESSGEVTSASATGGTPAATAVWYTFGPSSAINLRIQNSSTTSTNNYVATFGQSQVTPVDLGSVAGGQITITTVGQGHTTNTAMWVYDSNFQAIPGFGNDDVPDPVAHTVLQSTVSRELLSGTFYLALSNSMLMVDVAAPAPPADRQPNTPVSDPGVLQCTSNAVNQNCAFTLTDGAGVDHPVSGAPATKTDGFQVLFFKFTITPPATGSCCQPDGTCVLASQSGCAAKSGTYGGDGSDCSNASCVQPPLGACPQLDGTCLQLTQYACTSYAGAWQGAGTACSGRTFPAAVGAANSGVYTTFHSGAQQGAVLLDISTSTHPITVRRFDMFTIQAYNNSPATAPMDYFIYARSPMAADITGGAGSYVGYEGGTTNPGGNGIPPTNSDSTPAWVLVGRPTGLGTPGSWQMFTVVLDTPVTIPPNSTRGFCVAAHLGSVGYLTGGPTSFNGASGVTLSASVGKTYASSAAPGWGTNLAAGQKTFNGRVYYDIAGCGSADFNCDGDIGTDADIEAFFACISGSCPPPPCYNGADFNYDGDIGTDSDIESFFRVLAGGAC